MGAYLKNYRLDKAEQVLLRCEPEVLRRGGAWRIKYLNHYSTVKMKQGKEPEALEMLSAVLTRQTESHFNDTQVSVEEAVGHPVWVANENAAMLERCDLGSLVQRAHHWSPLRAEVGFLATQKDEERRVFSSPKDRHVEPWVELLARFGLIPVTGSEPP